MLNEGYVYMFTLCRVAFASAQKPDRIDKVLFTHNNSDFGAISVRGAEL